jgi:hypothetical protein
MKNIIITTFLLLCFLNLYPQNIHKHNSIPASISNVEFIYIQKNDNRISKNHNRTMISPLAITWTIELVFDISIEDTSFGRSVPYDIAGILPDGKIFRKTIQINEQTPYRDRFIVKEQVTIGKLGWADFILTTNNTPAKLNLYDYDIRSNKYSVNIKFSK